MRILIVPALALGLTGLAQPGLATSAPPASVAAAVAHIQTVGQEAMAVLTQERLTDERRDSSLRALLGQGFGISAICHQVVGEAWTAASPKEQSAFCGSFRDYLLGTLIDELSEGLSDFKVTAAERLDAESTRVATAVRRLGFTLAELTWIVRGGVEGPKIVDVITNGVSLVGTYKSEFSGIVRRQGLTALTAALTRKVARR